MVVKIIIVHLLLLKQHLLWSLWRHPLAMLECDGASDRQANKFTNPSRWGRWSNFRNYTVSLSLTHDGLVLPSIGVRGELR